MRNYKIAVAGTGYVGLSIATLLSQHHKVTAVDIIPEKVDMINNRKSPIQDDYIEKYLAEKELNLTATLDTKAAFWKGDPMPRTKKKVKSVVKTKVISARVTETVHELLHRQAEDAGMTLSEFAAQILMKGHVNTFERR